MNNHAVLYIEFVHRHWGAQVAFAHLWELIALVEGRRVQGK